MIDLSCDGYTDGIAELYSIAQKKLGEAGRTADLDTHEVILGSLLRASFVEGKCEAGRSALLLATQLESAVGWEAQRVLLRLINTGIEEALHSETPAESIWYLEQLFKRSWDHTSDSVFNAYLGTVREIEARFGATSDPSLIKQAGAIIEPCIDEGSLGRELRDILSTEPAAPYDRGAAEWMLRWLMRYAAVVGLSYTSEIKLAKLISYYAYRFGDTFPRDIRQMWPFKVAVSGRQTVVRLEKGVYPGIISVLPFEYAVDP